MFPGAQVSDRETAEREEEIRRTLVCTWGNVELSRQRRRSVSDRQECLDWRRFLMRPITCASLNERTLPMRPQLRRLLRRPERRRRQDYHVTRSKLASGSPPSQRRSSKLGHCPTAARQKCLGPGWGRVLSPLFRSENFWNLSGRAGPRVTAGANRANRCWPIAAASSEEDGSWCCPSAQLHRLKWVAAYTRVLLRRDAGQSGRRREVIGSAFSWYRQVQRQLHAELGRVGGDRASPLMPTLFVIR